MEELQEKKIAKKLKVLIGKPGLDGHDRGAKIIARALRDAGMEVVYSGLHRTPEEIVNIAIQEDVDVIGLSILSGAHMTIFPKILDLLKKESAEDILLFGGGIIPDDDRNDLLKIGVAEVFGPGTSTDDVIGYLNKKFEL